MDPKVESACCDRARELVEKMTVEERAGQLRFDAPAVPRLGIPFYNWWNEALHGVARAGVATMFPQAIGLAAMFDDEMMQRIGDIISTEARAKYNAYSSEGDRGIYKGLTFWSPNVNIFRDPRWGRGHETYGEDPYLTSRLGVAFVKGIQGDGKYLKAAACAKHFAVHSGPEGLRHEFDAVVSEKDLRETYLPAFEACVKEAKVEAIMGAYNRTNGEPCCGSKRLLGDILRDEWGFDGHVTSDCWAIADFHMHHMVTKTAPESAALALHNGCDVNCGNTYLHMLQAYQDGLVTEEEISRAAYRLMRTRARLGLFADDCPYDDIGYEVNDCAAHNAVSLEAARRCMVLLKNDGILPLHADELKSIAVIGPNADSREMLRGNYYGTASRYTTILEGIRDAVGDGLRVYYSEGCHLWKDRTEGLAEADDRIAEAVIAAKHADVTVLCLGMDALLEGEQGDGSNSAAAGDKIDLGLPGRQQKLLEAVCAVGKPVILVLGAGSALAVGYADDHCSAVLDAWYPGSHGGEAVADILFGKVSPGGKLPITFYRTTEELPDFCDYSMANRTYRYMENEALYPFGFGLTYGKVALDTAEATLPGENGSEVSVWIENTGDCAVDEVVQCYLKNWDSSYAVRNHSLVAFKRVSLRPGERQKVTLSLAPEAWKVVNDKGERIDDGKHCTLYVGVSQPDARSVALKGIAPLEIDITLP